MKEQTKHTPGPWKAINDPFHFDTLSTVIGGEEAPEQCTLKYPAMIEVGGYAGLEKQEANARLIASAPELLAACRELLNCIDPARDWSEAKAARAAIAKAEGRAE